MKAQTLRSSVSGEAAKVQVLEEARLIDRHQGPEAHGDRRELPEIRHQPRMRVGGKPPAVDLLAEVHELVLRQPALEESAGIDAGRGMTLHVDEIAAMRVRRGAPEVHEAGVVERGGGLEARDMAAELGGFLVRLEHDGEGVPADRGADAVLDGAVARMGRLPLDRDRVEIGGVRRIRDRRAPAPCTFHDLFEEKVKAFRTADLQHAFDRIEPFPGLERITVAGLVQGSLPMRDASKMWIAVGGKRTQPAPLQAPAQRAGAAASRAPPIPNEPIRGAPEDVSVT